MSFNTDPVEQALQDYKAGKIDSQALNAVMDAARAQEQAEEERDELMRELKRQNGRNYFISVGINIPLD